jgi:hypothetical protein
VEDSDATTYQGTIRNPQPHSPSLFAAFHAKIAKATRVKPLAPKENATWSDDTVFLMNSTQVMCQLHVLCTVLMKPRT